MTTSCRWEKLVRKGFRLQFGSWWLLDGKGRQRNSLRVEAHVLQRASRPGYVATGTAVTDELDERMDGMGRHKSPIHRRVLARLWNQQLKQERHLHLY